MPPKVKSGGVMAIAIRLIKKLKLIHATKSAMGRL
jgi:hypothetical protein